MSGSEAARRRRRRGRRTAETTAWSEAKSQAGMARSSRRPSPQLARSAGAARESCAAESDGGRVGVGGGEWGEVRPLHWRGGERRGNVYI